MTDERQDAVAQRLMRDLRIIAGAEALLTALEGGGLVAEALVLVQRHATSAADAANVLLRDMREQQSRSEWWSSPSPGGGDG